MKLLITGICGRLGRAVAAEAASRGWSVTGIDRRPWPAESRPPKGVEIHLGELEDTGLLNRIAGGATRLVHTSGLHGENLKSHDLSAFLRVNVENVARLLEWGEEKGIAHFCLSSTMDIVVGRRWKASGAAVLDESAPLQCDSAYGISRALMERLAAEFSRHRDLSIGVLRLMSFGYCADEELGTALLARRLACRDAARATIHTVLTDGLKGEVFHIGPKTPLTNTDIANALKNPEEVLEKYFPGATRIAEKAGFQLAPEMFWPVAAIGKARRLLGWEPLYTFETWLKAHGWAQGVSTNFEG
ncbi:MAG TPA: NAD(P)-dependent oxidoreductase [Chthoniobacteraceae bacterium]|nr:NAD(P)-dependent oxidoreductase [Chthoniobacteraceae bacterium]